jgi:inner membrane protein
MDNLTHSLVGALIGQMGLKRKTGLAMPTLIIAANIPDIDAVATLLGGHQHLAIRRGITHGPIAMLVLPLLLWAIMLAWDKWRPSQKRLAVHKGWLLALAYIGCLSHPLFDWFNSYGIRLLEPFSSQWFYGDTLFIIDLWLYALLGGGLWLSLRQERKGQSDWRRSARTAGIVAVTYIFANFAISTNAEKIADNLLRAEGVAGRRTVVANPVPAAFWRREIEWRDEARYGSGTYSLLNGVRLAPRAYPHNAKSWTLSAEAAADKNVAAYLFWSRMPVFEQDSEGLLIKDQRFSNPLVADRFTVRVPLRAKSGIE